MIITDLNYLEEVSSETGNALAGGGNIDFAINANVNVLKTVNFDINKNVNSNLDLDGQLATATSDAEAFGSGDLLAETTTFTLVDEANGLAFSFSEAISASEPVGMTMNGDDAVA